jgi:hypothetical protein
MSPRAASTSFASYTNYGQSVINVAAPGGDFVAGSVLEDLILAPGGAPR